MGVSVVVPQLGKDDAGGILAEWYVAEGDTVHTGDLLYRLERDHAVVDVEAESDGVIEFELRAGDTPAAGAVIARLVEPGEHEPPQSIEAVSEYAPTPLPLRHEPAETDASDADDGWLDWHEDEPGVSAWETTPPAASADDGKAHDESSPSPFGQTFEQLAETGPIEAADTQEEEPVDSALTDSRWQMLVDVAATPIDGETNESPVPADIGDVQEDASPGGASPEQAYADVESEAEAEQESRRDDAPGEGPDASWFEHRNEEDAPAGRETTAFGSPVDEPAPDELDPAAWVFDDAPGADRAPNGLLDVIATHDGGDWLAPPEPLSALPSDPVTSHHAPARVGRLPHTAHDHDQAVRGAREEARSTPGAGPAAWLSVDVDVRALLESTSDGQGDTDGMPEFEMAIGSTIAGALNHHNDLSGYARALFVRRMDVDGERTFRITGSGGGSSNEEGAPEDEPSCVVTSFAAMGVREAVPALPHGQPLAFAVGAPRDEVAFEGRAIVPAVRMTVTLAYDADKVSDLAVAALLADIARQLATPLSVSDAA